MRSALVCVTLLVVASTFTACEEKGSKGNGPIVLGDPATIVTETDSVYLQDMVMDYQPVQPTQPAQPAVDTPAVKTDTAKATAQATPAVEEKPKEQPAAKGNGLTIDFNELDVFIPNVAARGKNGTYQLTKGNLNGNQLKITDGTVQKVSQRYQSIVVAESNTGDLVLDRLSMTSGWQTLKGSGNTYTISGLEDRKIGAPKVTNASIRDAVTRAAKSRRLSKAQTQKVLSSVKSVRSANQRPLSVELRSVMWKIDGKDAKGKPFSKQVRIDLPL